MLPRYQILVLKTATPTLTVFGSRGPKCGTQTRPPPRIVSSLMCGCLFWNRRPVLRPHLQPVLKQMWWFKICWYFSRKWLQIFSCQLWFGSMEVVTGLEHPLCRYMTEKHWVLKRRWLWFQWTTGSPCLVSRTWVSKVLKVWNLFVLHN